MTLRAFAFSGARLELVFVRIGFVAIHAICESKGLLEITIDMTSGAIDRGVFAEKRILGLGVIERKSRQKFLPSPRSVALFAALLEGALVWIRVAVCTGLKFHILIARRPASHVRLVAFFASYLDMLTC